MIITIDNRNYDLNKMARIMHDLLLEEDKSYNQNIEAEAERTSPSWYTRKTANSYDKKPRQGRPEKTTYTEEEVRAILRFGATNGLNAVVAEYKIPKNKYYFLRKTYTNLTKQ